MRMRVWLALVVLGAAVFAIYRFYSGLSRAVSQEADAGPAVQATPRPRHDAVPVLQATPNPDHWTAQDHARQREMNRRATKFAETVGRGATSIGALGKPDFARLNISYAKPCTMKQLKTISRKYGVDAWGVGFTSMECVAEEGVISVPIGPGVEER